MPRRRPLSRLADLLRSAAQAVDRVAGPAVASPVTGPAPDATASPRRPGRPPEHWLRVVEAHAPGLLRDLPPDEPSPATAAPAYDGPDHGDAAVSLHAPTTAEGGPYTAPGYTSTDPFALLQPTQRPLSGYRTPGGAWSEAEQRGVGEVVRAAEPHGSPQTAVGPGESPRAVVRLGESLRDVVRPGESPQAVVRPGGSARAVRPGEFGRVGPDGIERSTPRDGDAVPAYSAAGTAAADGPRPADEDDEDTATPRRLGGPDAGWSHPTPRLPAPGRRVRAAGGLSSNRARLRDAGQPGAVPGPGRNGSGGWGGGDPARGGRWLRAVDAGRTADDTHPEASGPPTGYGSSRPTADDEADRTPMSGHPRRPTDGHGYPGRLTDGPAPGSRVIGGRELTGRPTTGYERTGSPTVRYRPGGRAVAGDGLWPAGGIPAGVDQTTDGKQFTGGEWAGGGGGRWPDLDPSGWSDRRRVDGPWPRLPDDAPLWSVAEVSGDDGRHLRRLDREQAGD
ncbi:hypothetical protein GCM10009541_30850 [Micromonospora gifhornensis]|uniref:Uncharacterized protein n=2 Tax=Micromonospora gifhornensis TaxID=84594 RepID=A0ABQ4IFW2_9ACTN|nr:hypothetical protein Vgi01_34850 [Micromonospora gifhornensis]